MTRKVSPPPPPPPLPPPPPPPPPLPAHWSPEQALAVFECLHALREQLWVMYGSAAQQAWLDQMQSLRPMPDFDPNDPF